MVIPKRGDTTFLAVDACTSLPAGGSKLFIQRPGVNGFLPSFNFGCRLPQTVKPWSPCEVEAFFLNKGLEKSEFFTKLTGNPGVILTDCKPVFQAKQKLDKGEFSSNKRLQSLLNNVSAKRYSIQLLSAKLPSSLLKLVDFGSRNPVECNLDSCTICKEKTADVLLVTSPDQDLSLMSEAAWKQFQHSCQDLRKAHALLMSGRKLSKQESKLTDVRTYFNKCTINKNGLIVVLKQVPLQPKPQELIVVPRAFSFTFAKALHVRLNHPNLSQMKKQWWRKYFMLDENKTLQKVFDSCHVPCQASKILPKELFTYTTQTKPERLGQYFNADVVEESKQKILVVRENLTSFTDAILIQNQTKQALKEGLIVILSRLRLADNPIVRVDGQSSLSSLRSDGSLEQLGITLEVGLPKNANKNAVADKAIRELREQIVKLSPTGGPISPSTLARATAFLNAIIRHAGKSSKELYLSRSQDSGKNLLLDDKEISDTQFSARQKSHPSSASYASRNGKPAIKPTLNVGDTVFIKSDRSKSRARQSFSVLSLDNVNQLATVQKFPMENYRHHPIQVHYQNLYKCNSNHTQTTSPEDASPFPVRVKAKNAQFLTHTPKYTPESDSDSECSVSSSSDQELDHTNEVISLSEDVSDLNSSLDTIVSVSSSSHAVVTSPSPPPEPQERLLILNQPLCSDVDYMRPGETIAIVQGDVWCKVLLNSHTGKKHAKRNSLYWNYSALDGSNPTGSYLYPGESWGVLRGDEIHVDLSAVNIVLPNQDGQGDVPLEEN